MTNNYCNISYVRIVLLVKVQLEFYALMFCYLVCFLSNKKKNTAMYKTRTKHYRGALFLRLTQPALGV